MTRSRGWSLAAGLALCLILIAVAMATTPAEDEVVTGYHDVRVGQSAGTDQFDVRVTGVRLTRELINSYDQPVRTRAAFVVVSLTARTPTHSAQYTDLQLDTADSHSYLPRGDFSGSGPKATEPGFRTAGTLIFELPPDRVPGSKLIIGPDGQSFSFYVIKVRVDLGLNARTSYAVRPVRVPEATFGVIGR